MDTLTPLQSSVSGATDRLRALLFDLEPPDLDQGLTWALRRAAEETFADTEMAWTVRENGPVEVAATTRVILYRIAREALTNVRKHAAARHVDVTISASRDGVEVTVADDGRGLGTQPSKPVPGHRGLFNMKDQAAIAGGRCTVADRPGGVLVTVWLPVVPASGMAPSH
jgi:signal transduction histidine kinase